MNDAYTPVASTKPKHSTIKAQQLQHIAQRLEKLPDSKKTAFRLALQEKGIDPWKLPIVPVTSNDGTYPLSFAQQRLWFVEQMEAGNTLYNLVFGLRFKGELNIHAVEQSIHDISRRHAILRTTYHSSEHGEGCQRVNAFMPWELTVESLVGHANKEEQLDAIVQKEASTPFDLSNDLMFRFKLIALNDDKTPLASRETVGIFVIHHIAFDYLSVELMVREFAILYTHLLVDGSKQVDKLLCDLPIQYADFADWQRQWAKSEDYFKQKDYWLQQLAGAPARLDLPHDFLRLTQPSCEGKRHGLALPAALSDQLRTLAQEQGVTLYILLLSLFNVLLYRYSQQDDICVGTSIANRGRNETENLLGFFVNLLVMRNRITPEQSFTHFLEQVNATAIAAYGHQDLPFDQLVDLLGVKRDASTTPLFQVLFVLTVSNDAATHVLPGVEVSAFNHDQGIARYELTLRVNDVGVGSALFCQFEYDSSLFEQQSIDSMLKHYQQLCNGVVSNPTSQVCHLPLSESISVTSSSVNRQAHLIPHTVKGIHHLFENLAITQGNKPAVVYEQQQLSYAELNQQANQLAHYLKHQGVGRETHVALYIERSVLLVVGLLGILKAGGTYVPLDIKWPAQRVNSLLADADVNIILSEKRWQKNINSFNTCSFNACKALYLKALYLDEENAAWSHESHKNPESQVQPDDAAYVIFTSGSTGKPKGVVIEHQQILHYSLGVMARLQEGQKSLSDKHFALISTIAADLGNTSLYGALCFGGCLHLISTDRAFDAGQVAQYMAHNKIDVLKIVPSHLQGLLSAAESEGILPAQLLPKNLLIVGGEASSPALLNAIRALSPQLRIVNHYGPTETTVGVLTHEVDSHQPIPEQRRIPLGSPLSGSQVYVLDSQLQPCPLGVPGELYIGGPGVARGYLNQHEITQERFIESPFDSGRLYQTGDRVRRLFNGELEFIGRLDKQVKLRGYRIELGDIEAVMRQLSLIENAIVHVQRGDVSDQLIAFIVLASKQTVSFHDLKALLSELTQQLSESLPDYMVPQRIEVLEALPLTANGKVDHQGLKQLASTASNTQHKESSCQPQTKNEAMLSDIWCQVLQRERVGLDDDFFELGGDSILSLQVIARAKKAGLKLSPKQLFNTPTIKHLAALAESANSNSNNAKTAWQLDSGAVPLTPIQHWFFEANHPNEDYWNQSMIFQLNRSLDFISLQQAAVGLVKHHDALRLRFESAKGLWQQQYSNIAEINAEQLCEIYYPEQLGLSQSATSADISKAIETQANATQRRLNLQHGPVIRFVYFALSGLTCAEDVTQRDRMLVVAHHLVVDGVSWRVLLNDLYRLYQQHTLKQPLTLGPKSNSFQQWGQQLTKYAASTTLAGEIDFWKSVGQFSKNELAKFNLHGELSSNQVKTQDAVTVSLSAEHTIKLLQDIPAVYGTSINDVLLASLVQALCNEGDSVLIELEGHGREVLDGHEITQNELELSQTVGWFTSRFPVRLDWRGGDMANLILGVKEQLQTIPNKGIGYGLLRYMHPDVAIRDAFSSQAKPLISFNYLGQFDGAMQETAPGLLSIAKESSGQSRDPDSQRSHALDLISRVSEQQLSMTWQYSTALHSKEWVEAVANRYKQALYDVITHCLEQKKYLQAEHIPLEGDLSSIAASQLVNLQPAHAKSRFCELPLFCLHHRGGHTLEYRALVKQLNKAIPVYGIQSRALIDDTYQGHDIEEVAQEYVGLIKSVQAEGPYRLLGWSLGGVLAMAISNLLEAQGQKVSFIGLIDAILPQPDRAELLNSDLLLDNLLAVFGEQATKRYEAINRDSREIFEQKIQSLNQEQALTFAYDWIVQQGLVDETVFDQQYLNLHYRTTVQSRRLIQSYRPKKLKAELHVWWAEQSLQEGLPPTPWQNYCSGITQQQVLTGGHFDIMKNKTLFNTLRKVLEP